MAENILLFQIGGEVRFALQISKLFIGCTALIIIAVIVVITINSITIIIIITINTITIIIIIKLFETDTSTCNLSLVASLLLQLPK